VQCVTQAIITQSPEFHEVSGNAPNDQNHRPFGRGREPAGKRSGTSPGWAFGFNRTRNARSSVAFSTAGPEARQRLAVKRPSDCRRYRRYASPTVGFTGGRKKSQSD